MAKVYLVTAGEYSDYHIHSAHSTQVRANLMASFVEGASVEEWEIDDSWANPASWPVGKGVWFVRVECDGTIRSCEQWGKREHAAKGESGIAVDGSFYVYVWAFGRDDAAKAAHDWYTRTKAEEAGIA